MTKMLMFSYVLLSIEHLDHCNSSKPGLTAGTVQKARP